MPGLRKCKISRQSQIFEGRKLFHLKRNRKQSWFLHLKLLVIQIHQHRLRCNSKKPKTRIVISIFSSELQGEFLWKMVSMKSSKFYFTRKYSPFDGNNLFVVILNFEDKTFKFLPHSICISMTLLSLTTVFRKEILRMFILISFNRKLKVVSQQGYRDSMTAVPWEPQHLWWCKRYEGWRQPRSQTPTPRRSSWTATPASLSSPPCSSTQTAAIIYSYCS